MNVFLWILQVLLALHTAMGAFWKLSNSEQTVTSLTTLPHGLWVAFSCIEILCCVGLILPGFKRSLGKLVPLSAAMIGAEMLFFSAMHLKSGMANHGEMIYWLVVAAFCAFIAFGRSVLKPIK